jgi:hypothetical protein
MALVNDFLYECETLTPYVNSISGGSNDGVAVSVVFNT